MPQSVDITKAQHSEAAPAQNSILVVDDNYASRLVAKVLLERENYKVTLAPNGKAALALSTQQVYDLILMDIQMPVMDGIQTAMAIRQTDNINCMTAIIAVTAYADKTVIADIRKAGISEMLTKPLQVVRLLPAWQRAKNKNLAIAKTASKSVNEPPNSPGIANASPSNLLVRAPKTVLSLTVLGPLIAAAPAPVLQRLFDKFYESTKISIMLISKHAIAAATGDIESLMIVRTQAHALKGSSANVGFIALSRLAARLQNLPPDFLDSTPLQLEVMFKLSQAELHCHLERNFAIAV